MTEISAWDALVTHFNLNPVETGIFRKYAEDKITYPDNLNLDELEVLYHQFLDDDPDEKVIDPNDPQGGKG